MATLSTFAQINENILVEHITDIQGANENKVYKINNTSRNFTILNDYPKSLLYYPNLRVKNGSEDLIHIQSSVPNDKLRIYFKSGYVVEDFVIEASVKSEAQNRKVSLGTLLIDKSVFTNGWLRITSPLTFGGRIYSTYVEFSIPSLYHLNNEVGDKINIWSVMRLKGQEPLVITIYDAVVNENDEVSTSSPRSVVFPLSSPAENFNVCMSLDNDDHSIEYFPYWGSNPFIPLSHHIMNQIESGSISLYYGEDANKNNGWEDFAESFDGERKWITQHELSISEVSNNEIISTSKVQFDEHYNTSNLEDYKYRYKPFVKEGKKVADVLLIVYICKLINRMDNTQVVRTASMSIEDPYKYYSSRKPLDIDFGRTKPSLTILNNKSKVHINNEGSSSKDKTVYVKEYYQMNEYKMNVEENSKTFYSSSELVFPIFRTSHLYKLRLINSKTNERVDMSGKGEYILRFHTKSANLDFKPTYSDNMNTILGELEFYIDETSATLVKDTDNDERVFSLLHKSENLETTLFSGIVTIK